MVMGKRILMIDDDELVQRLAKLALEKVAGWQMLPAGSGREGIAKAVAEQPDAVLLDVMMPDMDGPTTLGELRAGQATRHIPVVFLTATEHPAELERLLELGARAVIPKPFKPRELAGQLAAALGWSP